MQSISDEALKNSAHAPVLIIDLIFWEHWDPNESAGSTEKSLIVEIRNSIHPLRLSDDNRNGVLDTLHSSLSQTEGVRATVAGLLRHCHLWTHALSDLRKSALLAVVKTLPARLLTRCRIIRANTQLLRFRRGNRNHNRDQNCD